MLTIKNIHKIENQKVGDSNEWEIIEVDADEWYDKYIFHFKKWLPGNHAQYEEIILDRNGEWNDNVNKTVYSVDKRLFSKGYLADMDKVKDIFTAILKKR